MTRYFTLLTRETVQGPWAIEFGSYDRDEIKAEMALYPAARRMVIKTDGYQASIDAELAQLNFMSTIRSNPAFHVGAK